MGAVCCRSQPIDFDGEVTLFHFRLLKVVGKGAFGKVCPALSPDRSSSTTMSSGPNGSAQTDPSNVRAQVHQQNKGSQDEGCGQHHPRAKASREGWFPYPLTSDRTDSPLQIDHPFVVNLRYAFQDDENCFFVLDLMLGGDLRCECWFQSQMASRIYPRCLSIMRPVHLLRDYKFSEETVRFYAAQLSSALIYLHEHRIIHR